MMRKTLQMLLAGLILLGLTLTARAQTDAPALRHSIKADMLFPYYLWKAGREPYVFGRVSAEYEQQSAKYKHLSWVADFEFAYLPYRADLHTFTWPKLKGAWNPGFPYSSPSRTHQNSIALLAGLRWRIHFDAKEKIGAFIEPRAQLGWVHAKIYTEDIGLPTEFRDRLEVFPRLRIGGFWTIGRKWLLEPNVEVLRQHFIAGGRNEFRVFSELNLGYKI